MSQFYHKLEEYSKSDFYPFHMPGHKRNLGTVDISLPFSRDITEIHGFDNLHHAEDVLLKAQQEAAELYGVQESFFSINGSTAALLAAISAAVRPGGKILVSRNCHKAVFHAIYLRNLRPVYLYPQMEQKFGINGGILPSDVDNSLKKHPDIEAVLITSPTYDGVMSDVRQIAKIAHAAGIPLLVDEAHGAHFPFSTYFPESAITSGADLVIQSLHKTLPSMTQTAILHRCSNRVNRGKIVRFMDMYQTSSPSYILMESIDACIEKLKYNAKKMFAFYTEMLEETREKLCSLQILQLITEEISGQNAIYDYDKSKILISTGMCSGSRIHSILREKYHIELEMDSLSYITALTSVGDTREGFERLCHALSEIDLELLALGIQRKALVYPDPCIQMEQIMTISEAMDAETEVCPLMESERRISAEFAYFYPPGIPVMTPGERITGQVLDNVRRCRKQGFHLQGLQDYTNQSILTVVET